jgi:hypothetical protein
LTRDYSKFFKKFLAWRDFIEGGGVVAVKYYRSAENGWGIVFAAGRRQALYRGSWGYGGV